MFFSLSYPENTLIEKLQRNSIQWKCTVISYMVFVCIDSPEGSLKRKEGVCRTKVQGPSPIQIHSINTWPLLRLKLKHPGRFWQETLLLRQDHLVMLRSHPVVFWSHSWQWEKRCLHPQLVHFSVSTLSSDRTTQPWAGYCKKHLPEPNSNKPEARRRGKTPLWDCRLSRVDGDPWVPTCTAD